MTSNTGLTKGETAGIVVGIVGAIFSIASVFAAWKSWKLRRVSAKFNI
jgi:hypothetical protein